MIYRLLYSPTKTLVADKCRYIFRMKSVYFRPNTPPKINSFELIKVENALKNPMKGKSNQMPQFINMKKEKRRP